MYTIVIGIGRTFGQSVSMSSAQMATIEDGRPCREDDDCSDKQYCYMSGQCVDYTQCSRYNRQEGPRRSRDPSQCGPCLSGYSTEKLGTGGMALLCKKVNLKANSIEPARISNAVIITYIAGIFIILLIMLILFLFLWKKFFPRQEIRCLPWVEKHHLVQPTAPPAENNPFIVFPDTATTAPLNNNHKLRDKNLLVRAIPFIERDRVRVNPNYEYNLSDDDLNALEESDASIQPPAINNPNSWTPRESAVEIEDASLGDHGLEHRDNAMNTALVRSNYPSSSEVSNIGNSNIEENIDSYQSGNTNDGSNQDNNGNARDSEANDSQNRRERVKASNILITQRISMNINLVNND